MLYSIGCGDHHSRVTGFLYCDLEDVGIYVHGVTIQTTTVLTPNIVKN